MNRSWIPLGTLLLAGALAATLFALPTTAQANGCPLRFSQGTDGTAANPIRIDSVADLQVLTSNATCYLSAYVFQQTTDLNLTGVNWTPIGSGSGAFNGTYNGGGHTITGLIVSGTSGVGFIGTGTGATIRHLTFTGATITTTTGTAGVLAGVLLDSTVEDVHVRTSTVTGTTGPTGDDFVGGLIGTSQSSEITNVSSSATVQTRGASAGGLIGRTDGDTIVTASASGAVTAAGATAGGLIGSSCGMDLQYGSASGNVVAGGGASGGLVGFIGLCIGSISSMDARPQTVSDSYATGNVSGDGSLGGFAGDISSVTVLRSFATGTVTTTSGNAGGFAGVVVAATLTDVYARGAVSAAYTAGGLAAGATGVTVTRAYATGAVVGQLAAGGLIAGLAPTGGLTTSVTASFWDTQTTSQTSSLYGTGKTTSQMKAASTFSGADWSIASGWNADTSKTWGICAGANGGYPYLRWQYTDATETCTVVPSAPTSPSASVQNERLLITWQAPASDGGSAITSYTATAKPGGRSCTAAAPKLQCLITGLNNGTSYVVSITATNKRGVGAAATTGKVAPAPSLGVGRFSQSGTTIVTQISVDGPGALSQVGALDAGQGRRLVRGLRPLCRTSKSVTKAGTITLRCTVNPKQLKVGTNRVRLTTQFKAKGGGTFTRRQTFVVRGIASSATPSNVTG